MKGDHDFFDWLLDKTDISAESVPGQSIIEIVDSKRVLIECHHGIIQYSKSKIGIKVRWGIVIICGCDLEVTRMTKEQLTISGKIEDISFQRRSTV